MLSMIANKARIVFAENPVNFARNLLISWLHNPEDMKTQSLLMASAALVVSRIGIANLSAMNAHGTPEGPYRYREAIRTDMREAGAWVLSFGVLRFIQGLITKPTMNWLLGIKEHRNPDQFTFWDGLTKSLTGTKIEPFYPSFHSSAQTDFNPSRLAKLLTKPERMQSFIANVYGKEENVAGKMVKVASKEAEEAFLKNARTIGSITLASIPTILLSGMWLERYTRNHSEEAVDKVSRFFGYSLPKPEGDVQGKPQQSLRQAVRGKAAWPVASYVAVPPARAAAFQGMSSRQQGWLSSAPALGVPVYNAPHPVAAAAAFKGAGVPAPNNQRAIKPMTYPTPFGLSGGFAV